MERKAIFSFLQFLFACVPGKCSNCLYVQINHSKSLDMWSIHCQRIQCQQLLSWIIRQQLHQKQRRHQRLHRRQVRWLPQEMTLGWMTLVFGLSQVCYLLRFTMEFLLIIFEGLYGALFLFLLYVCVSTCCCKKSKEPEVLEVNNQNFDLMN